MDAPASASSEPTSSKQAICSASSFGMSTSQIVETPSAQRKKLALEDKLKEIEDAVALFSRTKVFVKVEDYNY